jgi:hypothetical protein
MYKIQQMGTILKNETKHYHDILSQVRHAYITVYSEKISITETQL